MSTHNSNRVSLAIAIFAILLILGGVFLLNQSFDNVTGAEVATRSEQTGTLREYEVTSRGNQEDENQSEAGQFPTDLVANAVPTNQTVVTQPDFVEEGEPESEPTTPVPAPEAPVESVSTPEPEPVVDEEVVKEVPAETPEEPEPEPAEPVALSRNQFVAEITNVTGNQYTLRINSCGLPNALYCRAGTILQLYSLNNFTSQTVETGQTYRFTGNFSEDNNGMFIGSLSSMDLV